MMNYIASGIVDYLVYGPWRGAREWGFPYTDKFPATACFPIIPGTRIHWPTLLLGILSSITVYILLSKTTLGFEMRVCSQGKKVADYLGVPYSSRLIIAMVISGGLAGLAGAYLSVAYTPTWIEGMTAGQGWIALALTVFSAWNPSYALIGSYLFGGIRILQFRLQPLGFSPRFYPPYHTYSR